MNTQEERFDCSVCSFSSTSETHLEKHVAKEHRSEGNASAAQPATEMQTRILDAAYAQQKRMERAAQPAAGTTPQSDTHLPCGHSKWDSRRDCVTCLQFAVDELNKRLAICEGDKS